MIIPYLASGKNSSVGKINNWIISVSAFLGLMTKL